MNEQAIKKQVELLRKGYNIDIYPNEVGRMCIECNLENEKFAANNNLGYEEISLFDLGIPEPFHKASLIGFNTENGPEWFIVDPTFGQFFEDELFKNYMFEKHNDFSTKLLQQGYIEFTLSNLSNYIDGFLFSKAYTEEIDTDLIYKNIDNLLERNNFSKPIRETQKRLIELLKIRAQTLKNNEDCKTK